MANLYTTLDLHKISHIRPTANDNVPHKKTLQIAIKSFTFGSNYCNEQSKSVEASWKTSKLRLQWLNENN